MNKRIKRLVNWLSEQGYSFRFSIVDQVDWESDTVTVHPNPNQEHLLYSLLHECGHIKIGNYDSYNKEFKSIAIANWDSRHSRSNIYRYKKLKEEMDAWEEGKNIAKECGIRLNKDRYDKYAAKCFMSYVKFYSDPNTTE